MKNSPENINRETFEYNPENEGDVINEILSRRRTITLEKARNLGYDYADYDQEYPDVHRVLLEYGSKICIVTIDYGGEEFSTYIKTITDQKKDRETTFLYKAARKIMQDVVNEKGQKFRYEFFAKNEKMRNWAKTTGQDIFHWEDESEGEETKNGKKVKYYSFKTSINPNNK
ncbi:MAG: hypothetical protein AB1465_06710 [Patescibacteria group bacterium]